jgi:NADH-quinone oxidoreductase subunit A
MASALDTSVQIAAYLALFASVGFLFVFVNLLVGRFLRPHNPSPEKQEIYECGEPTIGSSFVQFDLRFYVVALVFIIFDVEVAFLFPWATVFGKVTNLLHGPTPIVEVIDGQNYLTPIAAGVYRELGAEVAGDASIVTQSERVMREGIVTTVDGVSLVEFAGLQQIVTFSLVAVSIFFVVLLVGFAYEWRTGALDWVRAVTRVPSTTVTRTISTRGSPQDSVLSP